MRKQWLCTDCYHNWKGEEKTTLACPICGGKQFYQIGKIKVEL